MNTRRISKRGDQVIKRSEPAFSYPWETIKPLSMKSGRQSTEGYTHGSRWSVEVRVSREKSKALGPLVYCFNIFSFPMLTEIFYWCRACWSSEAGGGQSGFGTCCQGGGGNWNALGTWRQGGGGNPRSASTGSHSASGQTKGWSSDGGKMTRRRTTTWVILHVNTHLAKRSFLRRFPSLPAVNR
jgi:hypothetical protein